MLPQLMLLAMLTATDAVNKRPATAMLAVPDEAASAALAAAFAPPVQPIALLEALRRWRQAGTMRAEALLAADAANAAPAAAAAAPPPSGADGSLRYAGVSLCDRSAVGTHGSKRYAFDRSAAASCVPDGMDSDGEAADADVVADAAADVADDGVTAAAPDSDSDVMGSRSDSSSSGSDSD